MTHQLKILHRFRLCLNSPTTQCTILGVHCFVGVSKCTIPKSNLSWKSLQKKQCNDARPIGEYSQI